MTKHEIREVFINAIAEQYKLHNELIPEWLHIGDIDFELDEPTTKNDLGVDCVSRKEVFETIDDCNSDGLKGIFCSYDDGERFKEYIKNLPPATPQPRWIPVSERLPETNIYDGPGPVWKHEVLIAGYLSFDDKKETFITIAFAEDVRNKCVPNINVIAWMPLPEPYKEKK